MHQWSMNNHYICATQSRVGASLFCNDVDVIYRRAACISRPPTHHRTQRPRQRMMREVGYESTGAGGDDGGALPIYAQGGRYYTHCQGVGRGHSAHKVSQHHLYTISQYNRSRC
eukprot:1180709-Prorocentrum_minimum.AAC.2